MGYGKSLNKTAVLVFTLVFCTVIFSFANSRDAMAAEEYKLIINNGGVSNTYTLSTANGTDNGGLPLVPLGLLRDNTGVGLGWHQTGYGSVITWGRAEAPVVLLVDYPRLYTVNAEGAYAPQANTGMATAKYGVSYIPLATTAYLGFGGSVDKANKTVTLNFEGTATYMAPADVYAAAESTVVSYLNPSKYWLGSATTYYNSGIYGRTVNLTLAANAVNNVVIKPGQEFSFNKIVGPRTPARGYKKAIIFSGGSQVMGYGGGICQVSTTVYQGVKKAGLQITERHYHSLPVSYAKAGNDATVSYGSKDFRFVNNTGSNIYIKTSVNGGALSVSFFRGNLPTGTAKYLCNYR